MPLESKLGIYQSPYFRTAEDHFSKGYEPFSTYHQNQNDSSFMVSYNAIGLRGPLPLKEKDSSEFRITVLGDSFVEGYGAPGDSTIPILLESKLKKLQPNTSVINAGICGSNPIHEIALYNYSVKKYNPDLVIIFTNVTDIMDNEYYSHHNKLPAFEYLFAVSHIFRIFYANLIGYNISQEKRWGKPNPKTIINSRLILQRINAFKKQLTQNNQQLLIVYLPLKEEIYEHRKIKYTQTLRSLILHSELNYIDLTSEYQNQFKNIKEIDQYFCVNDFHNNSNGYNLITQMVAHDLTKKGFIHQ